MTRPDPVRPRAPAAPLPPHTSGEMIGAACLALFIPACALLFVWRAL